MKNRVLILEGDIKIGLSIQGFLLHTMCSLQLPIVSIRITIKTINLITDIDECASSPCENSGTCTQGINLYNCSCEPGYTGEQCEEGRSIHVSGFLINLVYSQ